VSGEGDASDFAAGALEAFQSAVRWVSSGYQYFKVLKGYLEYFSFLTKGKNRYL
jgi:hypothetical protein